VARVAEDVFTQCDCKHRLFRTQRVRLEDVPQVDGLAVGIRDFDSDDGLARERGNDPNRQGAKREGEVVGEIRLTLTPDAGSNSYIVITGPGCTVTQRPPMPKSCNFFSRIREFMIRLSRSYL